MTPYLSALSEAMGILAADPRTLFLGQGVCYPGVGYFQTLSSVPEDKRLEVPVFENTQVGLTLGLAVAGRLPISLFPRINFLIEGTGQLVQHVDKWHALTGTHPHLIIRTVVADGDPPGLDPGPQHLGDYTEALMRMCPNIEFHCLHSAEQVPLFYNHAFHVRVPHILVEYARLY
jgi:pyruvate/2-oxoglutarate/acetoin dehydrogenase E1 component